MSLDLKQYNFLIQECEKILNKNKEDLIFFSNGIFHVLKEHNSSIKKYKIIFSNIFFIKFLLIFFKNFIYSLLSFVNIDYLSQKKLNKKKIKYLFFSHILNNNQIKENKSKDFYFSGILEKIHKSDYDIIYLDHRNIYLNKKEDFFFINKRLNFVKELSIFLKIFFNSFKIIKLLLITDLNKKILLFALAENFSQDHFQNLRIYYNTINVLNFYLPKKIVVTFEGHVYEKLIFKACSQFTNITKIAYNHALMSKHQNSIKLNFSVETMPDVILASGVSSKNFLKKNLKNFSSIDIIGSIRHSLKKKNTNIYSTNCIVLPEAFEEENNFFFQFCTSILRQSLKFKFIIRLHPFFYDKAKLIYDKMVNYEFKNNLILSNNINQNNDFEHANSFLFRGSTLAVQAARFGLYPIYIKKQNEIGCNILHNDEDKILVARNPNECLKHLNYIYGKSYHNDFTDEYFSNMNPNIINKHFN